MKNAIACALVGGMFLFLLASGAQSQAHSKKKEYDYTKSKEFGQLADEDAKKVKRVVEDFVILEKAIKRYMKDNNAQPPQQLSDLTPKYLDALPVDPFAGKEQSERDVRINKDYKPSLEGKGYLYQRRGGPHFIVTKKKPLEFKSYPGAWRIKSVGLPDFPLRYRSKNGRGLIRSEGYFGGMILDVF